MFCTALATSRPSSVTAARPRRGEKRSARARPSESIPIGRAPTQQRRRTRARRPSAKKSPPPRSARIGMSCALRRCSPVATTSASSARRRASSRRVDLVVASTPAVAISARDPSSSRTIATRSNGTSPRSSRMNAPNASVELERRAERAGAPVGGVEQVDAAAELVAQRLGLLRARRRVLASRVASCWTSQPTISAISTIDAELERDEFHA